MNEDFFIDLDKTETVTPTTPKGIDLHYFFWLCLSGIIFLVGIYILNYSALSALALSCFVTGILFLLRFSLTILLKVLYVFCALFGFFLAIFYSLTKNK